MIISNTQVTMANTCTKAHDYRFVRNLEPKLEYMSKALYRGIIGHQALETYYICLKDGLTVDECKKAAQEIIQVEMTRVMVEFPEDFERVNLLADLFKLIDAYAEYYRVEPFEVLEIEKVYTTNIGDDLDYGLKLDVLIKMTQGEYYGDYIVMDHKFVYNFKTVADLEMNIQLPKYGKTLKANGIHVSKGMLNQIRYRSMKAPKPEDVFKRTTIKLDKATTQTIWDEQLETAKDIQAGIKPRRTLNEIVCRGCYFQQLCIGEMRGQDIKPMIIANYQPNTYGYYEMSGDE